MDGRAGERRGALGAACLARRRPPAADRARDWRGQAEWLVCHPRRPGHGHAHGHAHAVARTRQCYRDGAHARS